MDNRIVFVDRDTIQLLGTVNRPDTVCNLWKEKKKKNKGPKSPPAPDDLLEHLSNSGISVEQAKAHVELILEEMNTQSTTLKKTNRELAKEEKQQRLMETEFGRVKGSHGGRQNSEDIDQQFTLLKRQREHVRSLRRQVLPIRSRLKDLGREKYTYLKFANGPQVQRGVKGKGKANESSASTSSSSAPATGASADMSTIKSTPTLDRPGCLDYAESISIDKLIWQIDIHNSDSTKRPKEQVLIGVDPGRNIMFAAVPVPVKTAIKLKNRFEVLSTNDLEKIREQDKDFKAVLEKSCTQALQMIKIPEAHTTSVSHLRHISGLQKQQQFRDKRLKANRNKATRDMYERLGQKGMEMAGTANEVEEAAQVRRNSASLIRGFERSRPMRNKKHHTVLRLKRAYDFAASQERKCAQTGKYNLILVKAMRIRSLSFVSKATLLLFLYSYVQAATVRSISLYSVDNT